MTWRRFSVLLSGLSPMSCFLLTIRPGGSNEPRQIVTDPLAIERITQFK